MAAPPRCGAMGSSTMIGISRPMVLFPAYLVPFSIILHITTIRVLLANRRRARDEHASVATSAMTAG